MRIATWNVNGIRARLPLLLDWLQRQEPDVVCLQETKCEDDKFPREELEALDYRAEIHGQKGFNGVAILSRRPIDDVVTGMPGGEDGARLIAASVGDLRLLDAYVINGVKVDHQRYHDKLAWFGHLAEYVQASFDLGGKVVLLGDFNCTFDDRDIYAPDRWRERILCSTPEREALARLMAPGFTDAFRAFHDDAGHYTWWDFRTRGFERGNGLRIDHVLTSPAAAAACTGVEIDLEARAATKPSDHAPVIASFDE